MKLHARIGRVHLQIKGGGFDGPLLLTGEFGQAVGKSISNAKFHSL